MPEGKFAYQRTLATGERPNSKREHSKMKPIRKNSTPANEVTIIYAIQCFRDDENHGTSAKTSDAKNAFFFEKQLKPWTEKQGFVYLDQFDCGVACKFR